MKGNKFLGGILWTIGLLLAHLLIFFIPKNYTIAVWITYGFTLLAFLSQLTLWLYIWRKSLDAKETFLRTPVFMLSVCYMFFQIILCGVFPFWITASTKIVFIVNTLFLTVVWALLIISMIARNHIERIDSRQKDHHTLL